MWEATRIGISRKLGHENKKDDMKGKSVFFRRPPKNFANRFSKIPWGILGALVSVIGMVLSGVGDSGSHEAWAQEYEVHISGREPNVRKAVG